MHLKWQDTSGGESGFKIERLSGSTYVEIASVAPNIVDYSDNNLTAGSTYCYRVRAFSAAGASAPSNTACGTALASPTGAATPTPTGSTPPTSPNQPPTPLGPIAGQWSDYLVSMNIRSTDNDALGVMFRYQDAANYYRFSWFAEGKTRRLEKRINGIFQILAQDSVAYTIGQSYALQITVRDSALLVAIDGKTIFNVTDTSFSKGSIGLYSYYNAGSYFDDVRVQDLTTGNILLSDNFSDGNYVGWTIINDGADQGPSVWSVVDGAFAQTSNLGSPGGDNGRLGTYALYTRGNWTHYRMTFKMRSSDDDRLGAMFRVQDSNNFYRFSWNKSTPGRFLWKREKGVYSILAQDTVPYVTNQTYAVEIIAEGSNLRANIDGKPVFSISDQTFNGGTVALYSSYNQSSFFNDVLVEDLATKSVLLWDDFNDGNIAGWKPFDEPGTDSDPSRWSVTSGELVQSANIGSDAMGHPGTFLLY